MNEQWKPIEGFESLYEVSSTGKVRSLTTRRVLKFNTVDRYLRVALCKNGRSKQTRVHRIVAKHFVENPLNKPSVNHKDGNRLNNSATNLEWCTQAENSAHAAKSGLLSTGTDRSDSKLSKADLKLIDVLLKYYSLNHTELGILFKVSNTVIRSYALGLSYKKESIHAK